MVCPLVTDPLKESDANTSFILSPFLQYPSVFVPEIRVIRLCSERFAETAGAEK
jgi:hypothetical protein